MKPLVIIATLTVIAAALPSEAQRSTRQRLKSAPAAAATANAPYDTIFTEADSTAFAFSGYEKTLRSTRESFYVSNHTDSVIDRITVEVTYLDMQGRMLDRRTADIDITIEPSETRKAELRSWDSQKVMYYYRSPKPRSSAQATPYKLKIRLVSALRRKTD